MVVSINTTAGHAFRSYGHAFTPSPLAWERNAGRPRLPPPTPPFCCLLKNRPAPYYKAKPSQAICKTLRVVCGVMRTTL